MKHLRLVFLLAVLPAALVAHDHAKPAPEKKDAACACEDCQCTKDGAACTCAASAQEEAKPAAPAGHPLRGVIVEVRADRQALLVKHDEIPGVMRAMTMLLRVDESTLAAAKKDQAITATLYKHDGAWWLRDVQPAPAK